MEKVIDTQVSEMKYSVLMSVYAKDNPEYLQISIDSMLNQTVAPEQVVLVIDGPVPAELESVINKCSSNEELFTVVRLEKNEGLGHALNIGLRHCRNELAARMDADDISLPERCEKELRCFQKDRRLDICGCNLDEFLGSPENILTSRIVPSDYAQIKRFMRRRQAFNHPTVIYKKSAVLAAGGYQPLKRKEDFDLFSRMLAADAYAINLKESLYLYRVDKDNYKRRKSWDNFKSAVCVYWKHLKREGCSVLDFVFMSSAELVFFLAPYPIVKVLSDNFLRVKPKRS